MSSSAFLDLGAMPLAGSPRRGRRVVAYLVILCIAGGAALAFHHDVFGHRVQIQLPGPRRYPPSYRPALSTKTLENQRAVVEAIQPPQEETPARRSLVVY